MIKPPLPKPPRNWATPGVVLLEWFFALILGKAKKELMLMFSLIIPGLTPVSKIISWTSLNPDLK